jgi:serine phosphatase RsbU (regulator of sigma subunit)
LRQHRHLSSEQMLSAILEEVRRFGSQEQHDDVTLIIAKFRAGE